MNDVDENRLEWPTLLLLLTYVVWAAGTMLWQEQAVLSLLLTAVAIAQFSSLQHEALHGHPFHIAVLDEALVLPALALFVPFRRFRDTHLQHHFDPALTDPYDDPESNYHDPQVWARLPGAVRAVLRWNNTLAGRMIIGPLLGTVKFLHTDLTLIRAGNRAVVKAWLMHGVGLVIVLAWLLTWGTMPLWAYLVAVYFGLSLLRIRTFLEHRSHDAFRARTVVIEDRGPLALLFLNNNLHVVHHMHPGAAWYRLPGLYAAHKAHYLRRNDGYVYASYAEIFRRYFLRAKDPVPHPVWPVRKTGALPETGET